MKSEPVIEPQQEEKTYSDSGAYNLLTLGKNMEVYDLDEAINRQRQTALDRFRAAAAEREQAHNKREAEMKARHAAGKEDMSGAIDRLSKTLNKEEVLDETTYKEEHLAKDANGKVRVYMLRRAAAKEAHQKGGVVHKQGRGYVIKLKENEDVTSTYQPIQEETRAARTKIPTGTSPTIEGAGCGSGKEISTRKAISVKEAKKNYKEKINEIDMGTEPGISMSGSGENPSRGATASTRLKKRPFDEMQGDETTASIGAQKEDELTKQGIHISSFRKRNYAA